MNKTFKKVSGFGIAGYGSAVAVHGFNTAATFGGAFGTGALVAGTCGVGLAAIGLHMLMK